MTLRPRPQVEALPAYVPGRSAQAAMADHGIDRAIKLASNESSFGPLPSAARAIENALGSLNRYPDNGAVALRAALADSVGLAPERIAVGCGSVGLIQQLCLAYAGPGDEILFGDPSFEAYPVFTQLSGAGANRVPLRRQTLDADAIAAAFTPSTRLALLATPNNPTGTALRTAELTRIVDAAPETCLVVIDAAYQEFVSGADVPDPISLFSDRPNVAVLRTFSKAYGLAALRIGWMSAPEDVIANVNKVHLPFAENGVAQAAALGSVEARDEMADRVAGVTSERARVARTIRELGFVVPDPQGNFVWLPAAAGARDLAVALEKRGIVTRGFDGTGVRVTIGTPDENDAFLAAFGDAAGAENLANHWALPTGEAAERANGWLERLDDAERRLVEHGTTSHAGLTEPDPGGDEKWEAPQVWGHVGEFGDYWLTELDLVLAGEPDQAFGRTKIDEARRAAIAAGPERTPAQHLDAALRSIDRLRARLAELTTDDWDRAGTHSTLGRMTLEDQLQHFHIGHYEEHLAQLDKLAGR